MKTVVTGCAGFIGSHLCEALLRIGHEVLGIDCMDDHYDRALKWRNLSAVERVREEEQGVLAIRAPDDILGCYDDAYEGIDTVFHLAARPGVRASVGNGELYVRNNVLGTQAVLDRATRAGVKRFVVASSSSVYGNVPAPFREDGPTCPISPYGASKLAAEAMCDAHSKSHPDLSIASLRFFCAYGPRCRPDLILPKFAKLIEAGKPIPVFGDPEKTSRDYTYISDIIDGVIKAGEYCQHVLGHHKFNLGNGNPVTLKDAIDTIAGALGHDAVLDIQEPNPADNRTTHADVGKAARALGWRATTEYCEGVSRYVEWLERGS